MSTATDIQQPANSSSLRGLVARHPVAAFLVMAFVFAWSAMLPLLLSERGFGVLPIDLPWKPFASMLSVFGLALPAFLVTAATSGKDGGETCCAGASGGALEYIGTSSRFSGFSSSR